MRLKNALGKHIDGSQLQCQESSYMARVMFCSIKAETVKNALGRNLDGASHLQCHVSVLPHRKSAV